MVPLIVKTPNNKNDHGTNRDCFILNPDSTTPSHLEMYKFLGACIAFAMMAKSPIPLNLAPTVWKQLLGDKMNLADLESIDTYSSQVMTDLHRYGAALSDEEFEATVDQTFTTVLTNGDEVALLEGGQDRKVTKACIDEFIGLAVKARFTESTQ